MGRGTSSLVYLLAALIAALASLVVVTVTSGPAAATATKLPEVVIGLVGAVAGSAVPHTFSSSQGSPSEGSAGVGP